MPTNCTEERSGRIRSFSLAKTEEAAKSKKKVTKLLILRKEGDKCWFGREVKSENRRERDAKIWPRMLLLGVT
jgi:hypothetical protein